MPRIDVTQDVVLERIVDRLRSQLDLSDERCYDTLDPNSPPLVPPGGEYFIIVSPGTGRFVEGEQAPPNVTEEWTITVTLYVRVHLDRTGRDAEVLRNAGRGLFGVKWLVLRALVGHDLATDDEDTFLRQLCYATGTAAPEVVEGRREMGALFLYRLQLEFAIEFDWDLT